MTAASAFEDLLASEGLAPVNGPEVIAFDPVGAEAADAWTEWARDVLRSYPFPTAHQRRIWSLYSEGRSATEINAMMRCSRRAVFRALERVRNNVPSPPTDNPWRKSGRDGPAVPMPVRPGLLARFAKLAVQCCDLGRLLELASSEPELLKLLPQGDHMAKSNEAGPVPVTEKAGARHYARIILKKNEEVRVDRPRGGRSRYEVIPDVLARPTFAGLDVEFDTWSRAEGDDRHETTTVITIPWWKIAQAERVTGGEE